MSGSDMHHPEAGNRPNRLAAMPGRRGRAILAAAILAALVPLSGCGGDDGGGSIPQESADAMLASAAEIEQANAEGDCETAQSATTDLRSQVGELGDGQVKKSLDAMVTRLDENLDADCVEEGTSPDPETEEPEPEAPVETTPVPEETAPVEEETAPPPEEEEETPTPEQPPSEGGGPNGPQPGGGGGTAPPTGGIDEG